MPLKGLILCMSISRHVGQVSLCPIQCTLSILFSQKNSAVDGMPLVLGACQYMGKKYKVEIYLPMLCQRETILFAQPQHCCCCELLQHTRVLQDLGLRSNLEGIHQASNRRNGLLQGPDELIGASPQLQKLTLHTKLDLTQDE